MGQTQGIWSLHPQQADHLREAMPLKIGISCAIISVSRWIPALKRSPLWVKPKAKRMRKRHAPKKGRVIFRKMLYQRWGTARKYCKSLPEAKQKNPTTTGHMFCCWKPGCARVIDWFDWAAINWEKRTLTVKNGGNPKIGQHKITIIKENFGIWN